MLSRKIVYTTLFGLLILVFVLCAIINFERDLTLKVIFLDVGQGDSILISQGSNQVLIDGGKDGKNLLAKLGKYLPFWDRKIEVVVETHPDADHVGGLIDVFRAYQVENVFKTKMPSDSQTFATLEDDVNKEKAEIIEARAGDKIIFPNGASGEVLYPFDSIMNGNNTDTNAASVTLKLSLRANKFLFTGDLPIEQESQILAKNIDINANVLKVGHHGSKYSSGENFLDAVKPQDAIISVGKNNTYGHPNQEVLKRLLVHKINIFRTDELGDIVYACQNLHDDCKRQ